MTSAFDKIEQESVYTAARYIAPGRYRLLVKQVTMFESRQHQGKEFFCAEFTVLKTNSTEFGEGDSITWLQAMDKQVSVANVKKFAMALNPTCASEDITKEVMMEIISPENPTAGIEVDCEAYTATSKLNREYTRINFSGATGEWRGGSAPSADEE